MSGLSAFGSALAATTQMLLFSTISSRIFGRSASWNRNCAACKVREVHASRIQRRTFDTPIMRATRTSALVNGGSGGPSFFTILPPRIMHNSAGDCERICGHKCVSENIHIGLSLLGFTMFCTVLPCFINIEHYSFFILLTHKSSDMLGGLTPVGLEGAFGFFFGGISSQASYSHLYN